MKGGRSRSRWKYVFATYGCPSQPMPMGPRCFWIADFQFVTVSRFCSERSGRANIVSMAVWSQAFVTLSFEELVMTIPFAWK